MPFFLFMSGFLLYKNIDGTKENYKKVIWTLFSIIISLIPFISSKINSLSVFNWTIKDFLLGVFMYKFNGVMWYILYIYVYALFSPILYKIFSNKKIHTIFIVLLVIFSGAEKIILNTYKFVWPLFYYSIGAIVAINYKELFFKKFNNCLNCVLLCLFFISIAVSIDLKPNSSILLNMFYTVYRVLPMFFFWYSIDLFIDYIVNHQYFKAHTFLYFFHFIPIICIHKILSLIIKINNINLLIINILSILIILFVGILINKFIKEKIPFIHSILTGSR